MERVNKPKIPLNPWWCSVTEMPPSAEFCSPSIFSFGSQVALAEGVRCGGGHPRPDGLGARGLALCQACCRSFPEHPGPQQEGPPFFLVLPSPPRPHTCAPVVCFLLPAWLNPRGEPETHSLTGTAPSGGPFVLTRPLTILGSCKYCCIFCNDLVKVTP